jgi:hypothetical protein
LLIGTEPAQLARQATLGCGWLALCGLVALASWKRRRALLPWMLVALACVEGFISASVALPTAPGELFRKASALPQIEAPPGAAVACCVPYLFEPVAPTVDGAKLPLHAGVLEHARRLAPLTGALRGAAYPLAPDIGGFDPWPLRELIANQLPDLEHVLRERPGGEAIAAAGLIRILGAWGVEWFVSLRPMTQGGEGGSGGSAEPRDSEDTGAGAGSHSSHPRRSGLVPEGLEDLVLSVETERLAPALPVWLYRISSPMPRVRLSDRWSVAGGTMESLEAIATGADLPVLLAGAGVPPPPGSPMVRDTRPPPGGSGVQAGGAAGPDPADAPLLDWHATDTRMTARVRAEKEILLVQTSLARGGWKASVDGRPAPILGANVLHMAVLVPPGEHDVEFVYRMPRLAGGLTLSLTGAAAITTAAAALTVTRRRRRAAS